ncbi:MAG: class I SAM-dependent methyltransferase [Goleter apudmare HA4340-LM2]|jgi:ubiquinone/menaquinone biosynthesis C-methylase UbiE|nr:class I SAM-dependent methyltransferase [Goleter apudmare HA4340-LM2]
MTSPNWDQYANLGMLQAVIDPADSQGFKNRLIDRVQWRLLQPKLANTKSLLDFGCGTGRFASRIGDMGIKYAGIDTSENMIYTAKKINQSSDFQFADFNGLEIPFPDNYFDTCISCGVLQYIIKGEDSQQVLAEIYRVLQPEGRLIMIEQASRSNQKSGLGVRSLTEADYQDELSRLFTVKSISRVRSGELSRLSNRFLKISKFLPWLFNLGLDYVAQQVTDSINRADDFKLYKLRYFDILIDSNAILRN